MAPKQEVERDFTAYADKEPTGTMEAFGDWLIDEVGLTFANKKAEEQFRKGVQLGGTLRMEFQASDYWKSDERNPRSPAGQKARAAANGKATAQPKATRGKAKPQVDEDEPEDEAPAKRTTRQTRQTKPATGRSKAATGKAAATSGRRGRPASGRRGAAAAESNDAEAPY